MRLSNINPGLAKWVRSNRLRQRHAILYEKGLKLDISGNEICYTNSSQKLAKNMLCCKLHCRIYLI